MSQYIYRVYKEDGTKIFESCSRSDAKVWLTGSNYMVRQDILGNTPDKIYRA